MLHVLLGVALCSITALLPAGCSHIIVHVKSVVPTVQVRVASMLLVRQINPGFFFFFFWVGLLPRSVSSVLLTSPVYDGSLGRVLAMYDLVKRRRILWTLVFLWTCWKKDL